MTALQAGICFDAQLGIMIGGDVISCQSQIVILVHKTDIDACRARLAVVAVDTGAGDGIGRESAVDGLILFFLGCIQEFQDLI